MRSYILRKCVSPCYKSRQMMYLAPSPLHMCTNWYSKGSSITDVWVLKSILFKSRRQQLATDLESAIFTEFFLIPLSDLLMEVLQFAIGTRGLNIIGVRNGHNPLSEPPRPLKIPKTTIEAHEYCWPWFLLPMWSNLMDRMYHRPKWPIFLKTADNGTGNWPKWH